MSELVTCVCLAAAILIAGSVTVSCAHPPAPHHAPPQVPVELRSATPGARIQLFRPNAEPDSYTLLHECPDVCLVNIVPGEYKVEISESDDTVSGSRTLTLDRPTRLTMDPDTKVHRTTGLLLGIAGILAIPVGMAIMPGMCPDCTHREWETRRDIGTAVLLGGLIAAPVGWSMFGTSMRPEYEMEPLQQVPHRPSWSIKASPANDGMSIGGQFVF